jgi:hypothetical protein
VTCSRLLRGAGSPHPSIRLLQTRLNHQACAPVDVRFDQ